MTNPVKIKRAERKIARAKSKARPELLVNQAVDEWRCLNFWNNFDLSLDPIARRDRVERINVNSVSSQEFIEKYESSLRPVVITDVTQAWPAKGRWTIERLLRRYRNERFKCGEDDFGYNVKLKFKYFVHYMRTSCDDIPLYIFDGNFGEHPRKKELLQDYALPRYFSEDLFKHVGYKRRPPYRWIVIGGPRSGTGIHIDPLGTSAWNSLLIGYKRWCLFPTSAPRELVKLDPFIGGKQSSEAAQWFSIIYPKTQQPSWPEQFRPIEILQRPGETVFVPSGWWHVVLNLTETIAITQNFVSTSNFPIVWHKTVRNRPKLSQRWISQLRIHRPDLVELSKTVDINLPIGVTSDSSSGASSSSSSSCDCSSCELSDSEDSGQASLGGENRSSTKNQSRSHAPKKKYENERKWP